MKIKLLFGKRLSKVEPEEICLDIQRVRFIIITRSRRIISRMHTLIEYEGLNEELIDLKEAADEKREALSEVVTDVAYLTCAVRYDEAIDLLPDLNDKLSEFEESVYDFIESLKRYMPRVGLDISMMEKDLDEALLAKEEAVEILERAKALI